MVSTGEKCTLGVNCIEQPLSPFSAAVPKNHPLSRSSWNLIYISPNWNFCSPVTEVFKVPKDSSLHLSKNLLLTAQGNILSLTYVKALFPADLVPRCAATQESGGFALWSCPQLTRNSNIPAALVMTRYSSTCSYGASLNNPAAHLFQ